MVWRPSHVQRRNREPWAVEIGDHLIAGNVAIGFSGNRRWERPLAGGAAIWLFMSGFVPSVLTGQAFLVNELVIGLVLVAAAISAHLHLRDDIRHARPLTM